MSSLRAKNDAKKSKQLCLMISTFKAVKKYYHKKGKVTFNAPKKNALFLRKLSAMEFLTLQL